MEAAPEDRLAEDELISQMSSVYYLHLHKDVILTCRSRRTLTLAGMDTTSNALCRIFHLLALHPEVQNKLRREIVESCDDHALSYNELMELPYLDAVIRETLRV